MDITTLALAAAGAVTVAPDLDEIEETAALPLGTVTPATHDPDGREGRAIARATGAEVMGDGADARGLLQRHVASPDPAVEDDGYGPWEQTVVETDGTVRHVRMTHDQRVRRFNEGMFRRAFAVDRLSLEAMLPWRIRAGWRVVRELVRLKGLGTHDVPLEEALGARDVDQPDDDDLNHGTGVLDMDEPVTTRPVKNPDPWSVPTRMVTPGRASMNRDITPAMLDAMRRAETLPDDLLPRRLNGKTGRWEVHRGMAILPPPVPERHMRYSNEGLPPKVANSYDPEVDDPMLRLWLRVVEMIVIDLGVHRGSINQPDDGRLGVFGLIEATLCRACWPTRLQLVAWEQILIEKTLKLLVDDGVATAHKRLEEEHGLNRRERQGLVTLAHKLAREQVSPDREDARAIMVLRLEDMVRRSRGCLDLGAEFKAMKQLSTILGLTDAEHNDPMTEFTRIVKQVAGERRRERQAAGIIDVPAGPSRALPVAASE